MLRYVAYTDVIFRKTLRKCIHVYAFNNEIIIIYILDSYSELNSYCPSP